jgi:hypothetical protein
VNSSPYLKIILNLLFLNLAHLLLLDHLALAPFAYSFAYIGVLLFLPVEFNKIGLMFLMFGEGLLMDAYYNTPGIHAGSCVFVAYVRPYLLDAITPRMGYEANSGCSVKEQGLAWYSMYSFFLILIHHFLLFFLEAFSFDQLGLTLVKVLLSAAYTYFILLFIELALGGKSN